MGHYLEKALSLGIGTLHGWYTMGFSMKESLGQLSCNLKSRFQLKPKNWLFKNLKKDGIFLEVGLWWGIWALTRATQRGVNHNFRGGGLRLKSLGTKLVWTPCMYGLTRFLIQGQPLGNVITIF